MKRPFALFLLAVAVLVASGARAQTPAPTEGFAPAGTVPKYAPSRQVDLQHMRLELSFDMARHTLRGTETLTLAPIRDGLQRVTLDSARLQVRRVRLGEATLAHRTTEENLEIDLDRA